MFLSVSASFEISFSIVNAQSTPFTTTPIPHIIASIGDDVTFEAPNNYLNDSATNFVWDFGDGTSIITQGTTVTHTYNESGNFTVALKIQGETGEKTLQTFLITIGPSQDAIFSLITPTIAAISSATVILAYFYRKRDQKQSRASQELPEPVVLGASAPQYLSQGSKFSARFVAYSKSLEETVKDLLANLSPSSTLHLGLNKANWQKGTTVKVRLSGEHLKVEKADQDFIWNGDYNIVDFDVEVLLDAPKGVTILKFDVTINDFVVASIRLDLLITLSESSKELRSASVEAARTAFASYANEDRKRVMDRVDEITRAGLDVFLDCLSINPGEDWKAKIGEEIKQRDRFLLFWSRNAMESDWVTWEWKTALREKGKSAMEIHPLEPVSKAPPPIELNDLHFGSSFMLVREAFSNSDNKEESE